MDTQAILGKEVEEWRIATSRKQELGCPPTEIKSVRKRAPVPRAHRVNRFILLRS